MTPAMPNDHDWPALRAKATGQLPYDHPTCDKNQSLYGFSRDVEFCQLMCDMMEVEAKILCCAKAKA